MEKLKRSLLGVNTYASSHAQPCRRALLMRAIVLAWLRRKSEVADRDAISCERRNDPGAAHSPRRHGC